MNWCRRILRRHFLGDTMVRKLYPGGKAKAFNISYDDGVLQDVRLVRLLNTYGLKGTFNLNSGLMIREFEWIHESGLAVKRLSEKEAAVLYRGHEVASHTYSHPYLDQASESEIIKEMASDRFLLERLMGTNVAGYATPFTYYSDLIAACARRCGFEYARISEESGDYTVPSDFFRWKGGKFHWDPDLDSYVDGFLCCDQELALCQIVGHSYDLDVYDMWDRMEDIFRRISRNEDVAPMTNLELARYLRGMDSATITEEFIQNNSQYELWFRVEGETIRILPGVRYKRKD